MNANESRFLIYYQKVLNSLFLNRLNILFFFLY